MSVAPWIMESRRPVLEMVGALGGAGEARRGIACPACGAELRDTRRGAAGLTRDGLGWACHRCHAEGDAVDYAAYKRHGKRLAQLGPEERRELREHLAALELTTGRWSKHQVATRRMKPLPPAAAPAVEGPGAAEVDALWRCSRSVIADPEVSRLCIERGFSPELLLALDLARATPGPDAYDWPRWWPRGRAKCWRLVTRMWTARGELAGLHGRAVRETPVVDGKPLPKALGHVMRERAWMATPRAVAWLQGQVQAPVVAIAEGITDFLALACWARGRGGRWAELAILGGLSGSFAGADELPWSPGAVALVATHADTAGDRYADELNRQIGRRVDVRRCRFGGDDGR